MLNMSILFKLFSMCGSALKSAETSVVGRLFHSVLVRRQMLLAECWKPTEVSKQLLFIIVLWHLHLSLLFDGWSLLLTFFRWDWCQSFHLLRCCEHFDLCSAQVWLGCGGWVALDPFVLSSPSQTAFSLPYLVGGVTGDMTSWPETVTRHLTCVCAVSPRLN